MIQIIPRIDARFYTGFIRGRCAPSLDFIRLDREVSANRGGTERPPPESAALERNFEVWPILGGEATRANWRASMMDVIMVAAGVGFFVVAVFYVFACEKM